MYTYLTMTSGAQSGSHYLLDPLTENRIGRGAECLVVLSDPLCSRVHTIIFRDGDAWRLRDADSRNGSYVDGEKTDQATLEDGCEIRVGSTEFSFHISDQPPTADSHRALGVTQTIIRDAPIEAASVTAMPMIGLGESEQAQDLLLLYQLSIKLLGCADPHEVVRIGVDLLRERARASVAGFLWASDDGKLKPKLVIPEQAAQRVALSENLTELVIRDGHAIWIANQQSESGRESLEHYADALCVPLVSQGRVLGAMHVYLEHGRFRQSHFDFAISLANITSVALARARHDETLETEYARLRAKSSTSDEIVGRSPAVVELRSRIERLGKAAGSVLIRGESGAGKELVARAVHHSSTRADRPMLSVNCAAIPADLIESQLFGHKAGSFTGADRDHLGFFQQADLGTLFLDEVGEMTLQGQSKLLRILEGHPFLPVGAVSEVQVDVRVIAATNRDLLQYVREKKFREDLYYRLSVFEIHVPPLRERGGDVELLIDFFLDQFRQAHGRPQLGLSDAARAKLIAYAWPGNVRQLRNVIDSAVVLAADEAIEVDDLGLRDVGDGELESLRIDHWERKLITEALKRSGGAVPAAAQLLGIGRATLYRKIEDYGVPR